MTKKHFIELADIVRESRPSMTHESDGEATAAYKQWERMRNSLADFCKSQNHAFMRGRWMDYIEGECGPNGGKVAR